MNQLLLKKIEELTELAKVEGEPNAQIVLLILSGAIKSRQDGELARLCQSFVKTVLLPNIHKA